MAQSVFKRLQITENVWKFQKNDDDDDENDNDDGK